jgi:hypothetical protein
MKLNLKAFALTAAIMSGRRSEYNPKCPICPYRVGKRIF